MGCRRYIYHSSCEYLRSLFKICNALKEIKKEIKFIIRIRPVKNEISISYLMKALVEFADFIEFSHTKLFIDELSNIDCLLALSSTTLEQAINNNIPAMSIGETGYDHLSYYKGKNIPITHKKYDSLMKIEKLIGKKFIYFSNFERNKVLDFSSLLR